MKKFIYSLIAIVAMTACSSTDEPARQAEADNPSVSAKYLTEDEAVKVAQSALVEFGFIKSSRTYSSAEVSLFENESSRTTNSDTTYYVVNFSNGGFAIVSAYKNANTPVLAISGNGRFSKEKNPASVEYLSTLASAGIGIGGVRPWPVQPDTIVNIEDMYFEKENTTTVDINQFVPTKWDQGNPYNKFCPLVGDPARKAWVGCVAVAVGQILAKHRAPTSINGHDLNWDKMLAGPSANDLTDEGVDYVARLLREVGILCNMNYGVNGSGSNYYNAWLALKEMGFTESKTSNNKDAALESLKLHGPVYMKAHDLSNGGHAWVMDGYQEVETVWYAVYPKSNRRIKDSSSITKYAHMNWGWGGYGDGYYVFKDQLQDNSFDVGGYKFDTAFTFIYDIY